MGSVEPSNAGWSGTVRKKPPAVRTDDGCKVCLYASRLQVRHWWLVWSLTLAILFACYAARFEQPLWYPYDIPHLVMFGAAVILILLDNPLGFLAALSVDAFIRETSIFLIFVAAVIQFRSRRWSLALAAGSAVWLFSR
jgi:hypothetical protein